jgi:hypothetical protein
MLDDKNNEIKLTITQDKLLDILMHGATREDIAKLDSKMEASIAKLDKKIDNRCDKLDSKYDRIIFGIILAILIPIAIQMLPYLLHK